MELAFDAARPLIDAGVDAAKKSAAKATSPKPATKRSAMKIKKQKPKAKAKGTTFAMPKFEMKFKK